MIIFLFSIIGILISIIFILKYQATVRYGYKVVTSDSQGNFYSAIVSSKARVQYYLNKTARAPKYLADRGHHLLIFDTLHQACLFSIPNDKPTIFKVRYNSYDVTKLPNWCSVYWIDSLIIQPQPTTQFPEGTIAVKKLKPLHIILL